MHFNKATLTIPGMINYVVMSITFLNYYYACKAQGVDRRTRPYYGYLQPYGAWVAVTLQTLVLFCYGYTAFRPWAVDTFFANYTMQILAPILFIVWKVVKKTKKVKPEELDLVWDRPIIDKYEQTMLVEEPPSSFWKEMGMMVGIGRRKKVPSKTEA